MTGVPPSIERDLVQYVDLVASAEPAPGGGSVAAVVASLSAALGAMVCRFSTGRPKLAAHEPEIRELLAGLDRRQKELLVLARRDEAAYRLLHDAFALPRASDAEKARRKKAIGEASRGAAHVPLLVAREAATLVDLALRLLEIGNPNLSSDAGVMGLLAAASCRSALLNVKVNLPGLFEEERGTIADEVARLEAGVETARAGLVERIG
jgi:formiminotetrahydrofolate cyclodeaminase